MLAASATLGPMVALPQAGQPPIALDIGDVLRLRRPHPCGGDRWTVRRLGADIGLTCCTCGRHALLERRRLERRLLGIVEPAQSAAAGVLGEPGAAGRDATGRVPRTGGRAPR